MRFKELTERFPTSNPGLPGYVLVEATRAFSNRGTIRTFWMHKSSIKMVDEAAEDFWLLWYDNGVYRPACFA